ncbi:MAG: hypothetical protein H6555_10775 [Lewinellaceae bacterium]|nr:hypothetical protein [Lewinellaceae bacterium]
MKQLRSRIFLFLGMLLATVLCGQGEKAARIAVVKTPDEVFKGTFLQLGAGYSYQSIRDWGVSPLIYNGFVPLGMGSIQVAGRRWQFAAEFGIGSGTVDAVKNARFNSSSNTYFHSGHLLYRLKAPREMGLHYAVGLRYNGLTLQRSTPSFLNASGVVESLNALLASGEVAWRLQWNQKHGKFLFFPHRPGTRYIQARAQLSVPLLNTQWRPTFSYVDDFTNGNTSLLDNNTLRTGGWWLNTHLELQYYLHNGNALFLQYRWDALQSGGEINRYELANHAYQLGLLFRLN